MIVEIDGDRYSIWRHPSIFTSRNNATVKKEDVTIDLILKPGENCRIRGVGVSRDKSGQRMQGIAMLACESGEPTCSEAFLPEGITIDLLRQIGMVD